MALMEHDGPGGVDLGDGGQVDVGDEGVECLQKTYDMKKLNMHNSGLFTNYVSDQRGEGEGLAITDTG